MKSYKLGEPLFIVHFGELWLRGRNRNFYIDMIKRNLLEQLKEEDFKFEQQYDRFILRINKKSDIQSIKNKLRTVFGISVFELAYETRPKLDAICRTSESILRILKPKHQKIKINAHRSYKELKFNSVDIVKKVAKIIQELEFDPEVHDYDTELYINVTDKAAFISIDKTKCLGGLPVGTSGKGVILMSGGIDSPVASWYAMKRGIEPVYVHVHASQNDNELSESKLPGIIGILSKYYPHYKVYYIPSHIFQVAAIKSGRYELILLKAFMLRLAERIAEKEEANLIFTGESLGQVASQTSSNLFAEQHGVKMPIMRPLIGFDKEEIIKIARSIGTYEESIKPYKDVCSINSKNPKTKTKIEKMDEIIKSVNLDNIVTRSLKLAKIEEV